MAGSRSIGDQQRGVGWTQTMGAGPAAVAARAGIHYGWVVVGVTFLAVLITAGVRAAPGVLIEPLEAEFGWTRGQISLALSLSLLTYGMAAPFSGWLLDRLGIRGIAIGFLTVAVAGVALTGFITSLWQMHLYWGVVVGVGTGGMAGVMGAAVANVWFAARRGLVTGIIGGAISAGQLIFLPLLVRITDRWGWQAAITFLSLALGGVVLPLVLLLVRSRPADVGLEPYGAGAVGISRIGDNRGTPLLRALGTGEFWLLALSFGICGFTTAGLIGTHFIPHAVEHGFTRGEAAGILSLIGAFNVVGTIGSGWLCDRYSPRVLLACYYLFRALALLVLPLISTLPLMSLFAVVYGLDYIATVPPTVMLVADRFGRRSVGTIYGWITFMHWIGGAAAASLAGWIHDTAGDYTAAIYLAGLLGLLAAAMAFGLRWRRPVPAAMAAG